MPGPIVPNTVLQRYLSDYTAHHLDEIEATYATLHAEIFNTGASLKTDRALLITAGAAGAGKSTHLRQKVEKLAATGARRYIRLDIDDILPRFPSFRWNAGQLTDYFQGLKNEEHRRALRDTTREWTLAAKHVADRLLNDCVEMRLPVAFETSAHTGHIQDFFDGAKANGYTIEIDLCDAPLSVKQQASLGRFDRGEAYIDPAAVDRKHQAVIANMHRFANNADRLNILWREQAHKELVLVASTEPSGSYIHDRHVAGAFDAIHRNETGISINMMLAINMQARAARTPGILPRAVAQ